MEFLKRLCSEEHGIHQPGVLPPIEGVVHVRGVGRDGELCDYPKGRQDKKVLRPGRTH
jgi:hypothetical protein